MTSPAIRVVTLDEITSTVTMAGVIAPVRAAFIAHAGGRATNPAPWHLDLPDADGEVHVKGAYLHDAPHFAVKISTGFYRNPARGLPASSGMVAVFDARTGQPALLLLDNGYLTELRTAAAGALATDALAQPAITTAAVIGTGGQAHHQIQALLHVRRPTHLTVYGRDRNRAAAFAQWAASQHTWQVTIALSVESAVRQAQVVITTTTSTDPLVYGEWLTPGAHVTAVGADNPTKREIDVSALHSADRIAVDDLHQARTLGELKSLDDATVARLPVAPLAGILTGDATGRIRPDDITIADLTGLGVQDAAVAQHLAALFLSGDDA